MSEANLSALLSPKKLVNFWARVNKAAAHGCWLWTGAVGPSGYGTTMVRRHYQAAHRVSWQLASGAIPPGLQVCHHCDVRYPVGDWGYRRCVNPAHLFLGTNRDNHQDAMRKGRKASGDRHGSRTHPERVPRGERSGNARLTAETVRAIRRERAAGEALWDIARRHGTTAASVSRICLRQAWQHVE